MFLLWEDIPLVMEFQAWEYKIKQVMYGKVIMREENVDIFRIFTLTFLLRLFTFKKRIHLILYPQGRNSKPVLKYFLFTIA